MPAVDDDVGEGMAGKLSNESSPASTGRPGYGSKSSAHSAPGCFTGHGGRTVVVELPMTRTLSPDDQVRLAGLATALAARDTEAGGDEGGDGDGIDDEQLAAFASAKSSVSSIGVSRKGSRSAGQHGHDGHLVAPPVGMAPMSLPTAYDGAVVAVADDLTDSSRWEETDVVDVPGVGDVGHAPRPSPGHGHGHGPHAASRRSSAVPMHLRDRRGNAWVALDENGSSFSSISLGCPFISNSSICLLCVPSSLLFLSFFNSGGCAAGVAVGHRDQCLRGPDIRLPRVWLGPGLPMRQPCSQPPGTRRPAGHR